MKLFEAFLGARRTASFGASTGVQREPLPGSLIDREILCGKILTQTDSCSLTKHFLFVDDFSVRIVQGTHKHTKLATHLLDYGYWHRASVIAPMIAPMIVMIIAQ